MADQDTDEQDPSIEEILDSIRQIISDDEDESGEEESTAPEPEEASDDSDDEIVDLTDEVDPAPEEEPEPEPEPQPEPEPTLPQDDEMDIIMQDAEEPAEETTISEPPPKKEPIAPTAPRMRDEEDSILTRAAKEAALDGFTDLVRKTAVEHNGITLEEIVRAELRPLLKGWLDDHLPSIIERLVREELERLSKRALEE